MIDTQAQTNLVDGEVEEVKRRTGRPHLDGSAPGQGYYMKIVALSVRGADRDLLTRIGSGNRSLGLRRLVDLAQEHDLFDRLLPVE